MPRKDAAEPALIAGHYVHAAGKRGARELLVVGEQGKLQASALLDQQQGREVNGIQRPDYRRERLSGTGQYLFADRHAMTGPVNGFKIQPELNAVGVPDFPL